MFPEPCIRAVLPSRFGTSIIREDSYIQELPIPKERWLGRLKNRVRGRYILRWQGILDTDFESCSLWVAFVRAEKQMSGNRKWLCWRIASFGFRESRIPFQAPSIEIIWDDHSPQILVLHSSKYSSGFAVLSCSIQLTVPSRNRTLGTTGTSRFFSAGADSPQTCSS